MSEATETLGEMLAGPIEVGEPDVCANLAVYPLILAGAKLEYRSAAAAGAAVSIGERKSGASVGDLYVGNSSPHKVMLYEGEELVGAQQNRVIDVTTLIEPGSEISVAVTCIEAGRWDGSRHGELFNRANRTADADLRGKKKRAMMEQAARGLEARPSQGEVWEEVDSRQADFAVSSPTDSLSEVFERREDETAAIADAINLRGGQCGMVAAIDGRTTVVDLVSRPEVFADLHSALVAGYALDSLRAGVAEPTDDPPAVATVRGTLLMIGGAAPSARAPGAGLGETAFFSTAGVAGSALTVDGELIQLSAHPPQP